MKKLVLFAAMAALLIAPGTAGAQTPVVTSLAASPMTVCSNFASEITWVTTGATTVELSGGSFNSMPVALGGGIMSDALTTATTFTITAYNGSDVTSRSITVSVIACPTGVKEVTPAIADLSGTVTIIDICGQIVDQYQYGPNMLPVRKALSPGLYVKRTVNVLGVQRATEKIQVVE